MYLYVSSHTSTYKTYTSKYFVLRTAVSRQSGQTTWSRNRHMLLASCTFPGARFIITFRKPIIKCDTEYFPSTKFQTAILALTWEWPSAVSTRPVLVTQRREVKKKRRAKQTCRQTRCTHQHQHLAHNHTYRTSIYHTTALLVQHAANKCGTKQLTTKTGQPEKLELWNVSTLWTVHPILIAAVSSCGQQSHPTKQKKRANGGCVCVCLHRAACWYYRQ